MLNVIKKQRMILKMVNKDTAILITKIAKIIAKLPEDPELVKKYKR